VVCWYGGVASELSQATGGSGAYVRSFALGVVAGLRSVLPLAALSVALQGVDQDEQPVRFLSSAPALLPNRTDAPLLGGRVVTGALAGGTRAQMGGGSPLVGSLLGAAGGWVGSWAGYALRRRLGQALGAPDLVVALAEDALALAVGSWAVSRA
jgi:uncharacterized membrane protein